MDLRSRKTAVIISVLVLVIIALVALIFFLSQRNRTTTQNSVTVAAGGLITTDKLDKVPVLNTVEKKAVSRETIEYIQTQRNPDGYYNYISHYDEQCRTENGTRMCPFNNENVFETTNAWTSLAYLSAFKIYNDENYLNQAKIDLNKLMTWCKEDLSQCQWVLVQAIKMYETTKDENILSFLEEMGEYMLANPSPTETQPMLTSIEGRELAMLYGVTKDPRYLAEAENRLVKARQELDAQDPSIYRRGSFQESVHVCWYSLAELEVSKQKPDPLRMIVLRNFVDKADLPRYYNSFAHPVEIQPCIELYYELAAVTAQEKYKKTGDYLLSLFTIDFWDNAKNKKYYGEGGTIMNGHPNLVTLDGKYVGLTDSAYTLYLTSF